MATSKKTPTKTSASDKDNIAKVAFDRAQDAMPAGDTLATAASDMADRIQDHTNVDLNKMADDASDFVRRNPGTSLAIAAGAGALLGYLVTKRT